MTVQVKSHGKFYKEPKPEMDFKRMIFTHVCKNCGCEFSFGWFDAKLLGYKVSPKDPFKIDDYRSIDCPECNNKCGFINLEEEPFELTKEVAK